MTETLTMMTLKSLDGILVGRIAIFVRWQYLPENIALDMDVMLSAPTAIMTFSAVPFGRD